MNNLRRVLLGTFVYAIILVLAAPYSSAAGLMLTFPALNGLALLYAEQENVSGMAKSMLWMPVVNGVLCASYIFLFLALAHIAYANWLALALLAFIAALWLGIVRQKRIRDGIPSERQKTYALVLTFLGAILLIGAFLTIDGSGPTTTTPYATNVVQDAWRTISINWYKVALFAAAFAAFLVLSERLKLSDAAQGILAGLPLVPFGGLVSIAGYGGDISARIAALKGMGVGVWLGPAVAIWFVFFISRILGERRPRQSARADFWERLATVVLGWIACGVVIAAITGSVNFFS